MRVLFRKNHTSLRVLFEEIHTSLSEKLEKSAFTNIYGTIFGTFLGQMILICKGTKN